MTQAELFDILANGENSGVEFKRDDVRPEKIAREVVAMANFKGGRVFLGVEDDGTISGLTRNATDCEKWVMDTIFRHYIDPQIIPFYEEVVTPNGVVAVITIEQGTTKPYAVMHNERPDIYIRTGSINQLATREQIIRLAQESGFIHAETLPVSGSSISDIDLALFLNYYKKNYDETLDPDDYEMIKQRLLQLDLMANHEGKTFVCSLAGLLLFGKHPLRFLHQSGFRIIHYSGSEQSINTQSDEVVSGAIAELKNDFREILIPGLVTRIMLNLQEKLSVEAIASDHITRERNWEYPPEILRELIVNALIHRDYTKANQNRIEIFADRIEITSFGRLPNTLTIEKIMAGQQYPRNPILIRITKDYGFIDDRGLGIRRKVLPILKQNGFKEPFFEQTDDYLKIVVFKK